jgi:hypothetical protein
VTDSVKIIVRGLPELSAGFGAFLDGLADEMRPGFVPIRRYRGLEGEPFTVDKIEQVARATGFVVR